MKLRWDRFGGQVGIGLIVLGIIVVFLGWNGAASLDRVPSQFPYLLSGGFLGLCLVVAGVGLMIVQNQREDRAALQATIDELRRVVELGGVPSSNGSSAPAGGDTVVAGTTSYHRPGCRLLEGREGLPTMSADEARARGLGPCRTCAPDGDPEATAEIKARKRRSRSK